MSTVAKPRNHCLVPPAERAVAGHACAIQTSSQGQTMRFCVTHYPATQHLLCARRFTCVAFHPRWAHGVFPVVPEEAPGGGHTAVNPGAASSPEQRDSCPLCQGVHTQNCPSRPLGPDLAALSCQCVSAPESSDAFALSLLLAR